jgi:transposase
MSVAERKRLELFGRVRDGELSVAAAAAVLGISERQAWRVKARYVREGDGGLVHRLRGKPSNRETDGAVRSAVLELYREKYAGWGPTLACEYLSTEDGREVSHDTLGRWLREEGLSGPRRKRGKHRSRRPRRERRGELVQMDGSWHDWFEGRGGAPWCCLMVLVDDATGRAFARFYDRETLAAAFDVFGRYARGHGLPRALYVDKAGIYRPDPADDAPTQFGRAMADLGVELILANSPQAEGRVERMNGTLQDRLVKELRLPGVSDIASANRLLEAGGGFMDGLNERFAVAARRKPADLHRPVTAGMKLDEVLCVHEGRAVGRDWCVQWRGRLLQVDERHAPLDLPRPGRRVAVIEKLDGTLLLRYGTAALTWREVARRPAKPKAARKPTVNNKRWKPPADHPFRRGLGPPPRRPGLGGSAPSPRPAGRKD